MATLFTALNLKDSEGKLFKILEFNKTPVTKEALNKAFIQAMSGDLTAHVL